MREARRSTTGAGGSKMKSLCSILMLLVAVSASAADDWWVILERPVVEAEADALADSLLAMAGVVSSAKGDALTLADMTEMRESIQRMLAAFDTAIESERTSGATPFEKVNRHYAAMLVERELTPLRSNLLWLASNVSPGAANYYRVILVTTDAVPNLGRLQAVVLAMPAVAEIRLAP